MLARLLVLVGYCLVVQAVVVPDHRSEKHVVAFPAAGYPHGKAFDDMGIVSDGTHRRLAQISVVGCIPGVHLTGMSLYYRDNHNNPDLELVLAHGSAEIDAQWQDYRLALDEYVKEVRVTTWDKKVRQFRATVYHTRIGHIRITTSKNHVYECGAYDQWDSAWTWGGDDKALLYFSGSQGDAIDQLQAHFIPVEDYF